MYFKYFKLIIINYYIISNTSNINYNKGAMQIIIISTSKVVVIFINLKLHFPLSIKHIFMHIIQDIGNHNNLDNT